MHKIVLLAGITAVALSTAPAFAQSGQAVYDSSCVSCHRPGVAGAPKLGDAQAWEPLLAKGVEAMTDTVVKGSGAMPPNGGCADCSREDLAAAVQYMVDQVQ